MQRSNPKRVPAQFLQALKSTPQIPSKPRTTSKENVMPMTKHVNIPRQLPTKNQVLVKEIQKNNQNGQRMSRIKQDDFTKISQSYVLDGNCLRKYETKNMTVVSNVRKGNNHEQISKVSYESQRMLHGLVSFQQKVKLEYLEKKGFLKPEQKARLQQARKQNQFPLQPIKSKISNIQQDQQNSLEKRLQTLPQYIHDPQYQQVSDEEQCYPVPPNAALTYGHQQAWRYPCSQGLNIQRSQQHMYLTASKKPNREQQAYYKSARNPYQGQPTYAQQKERQAKIMVTAPKDFQVQQEPCYQQEQYQVPYRSGQFPHRHDMPYEMHPAHYLPQKNIKPSQKHSNDKYYYDNSFYPYHYRQHRRQSRFDQRSEPKKQVTHMYAENGRFTKPKQYESTFGNPSMHNHTKKNSGFYPNSHCPHTYGKPYY